MRSILETPQIIKDREKLTETYIPARDELLYRDEAIKELGIYFSYVLQKSAPPHILILGTRGTGKTALIRFILEELKKEIARKKEKGEIDEKEKIGYIGYVIKPKTAHECIVYLCKWMGFDFPKRGLSFFELVEKWQEQVKDKISIMVIDEIDTLPEKDLNELLYHLSRRGKTCVVGISQRITIMDRITDPSVKSSFIPRTIILHPYTTKQLESILKKRVKIGFYPNTIDEGATSLCASLATQAGGGDCRYAIQLLLFSAEEALKAGDKKVEEKHIRKAQKEVERKYLEESIGELSIPQKILLHLILHYKKIETPQLYAAFNTFATRYGYMQLTTRRLGDYLNDLINLGFITREEVRKGKGKGVSSYVSPTFIGGERMFSKEAEKLLEEKLGLKEEEKIEIEIKR